MAREDETIKKQQTLLRSDFQDDKSGPRGKLESKPELDYVERKKPFKPRGKPGSATPPRQQQKPKKCTRCGKSPAHGRQQCPAREEVCHRFGKKGTVCRAHGAVGTVESIKDDEAFMGVVQQSKGGPLHCL